MEKKAIRYAWINTARIHLLAWSTLELEDTALMRRVLNNYKKKSISRLAISKGVPTQLSWSWLPQWRCYTWSPSFTGADATGNEISRQVGRRSTRRYVRQHPSTRQLQGQLDITSGWKKSRAPAHVPYGYARLANSPANSPRGTTPLIKYMYKY